MSCCLATDTSTRWVGGRCRAAWMAVCAVEGAGDGGGALDDMNCLEDGGVRGSIGSWDQFQANKEQFGIITEPWGCAMEEM